MEDRILHTPSKMGCMCQLCMLEALDNWFQETDDPEVREMVAEIVLEDYPLDVGMYENMHD